MLVVCLSQTINAAFEQQWKVAKAKYGLSFKDSKAERKAFNTYAKNMEMIEQTNAMGDLGYQLGENQLTYLTEKEIQEKYLVKPGVLTNFLDKAYKYASSVEPPVVNSVPANLNFSYTLNPAKDQGPCGSCYSFSAVNIFLLSFFL